MKNQKYLNSCGFALLALITLAGFQNCSKVHVADVASTGEVQPVAATSIPTSPSSVVQPKLLMKINSCQANTMCVVDYYLSDALSEKFSFTWQTDDTKYLQDPTKYAQPGVHYVPASGVLVFNPGETHQQIHIQALTGFSQILIPFLFDNCMINSTAVDCQSVLSQ